MGWQETAKRKLEEASQGDFFKLGIGPNRFRVLPSGTWPNGGDEETGPVYFYNRHSDVGPNKKFATCGHWHDEEGALQGECYLCDVVIPKMQQRDEKTAELASKMEMKEYACLQVTGYRDGRYSPPQKLEFAIGGGASYGAWIISKLVSEKQYEHPSKGRDFIIVGSGGDGLKRRYNEKEVATEPSVVPRAVFDARKNWEDLIHPYDEEYIKAALAGREYKPAEADAWGAAAEDASSYDETAYGEGYEAEAEAGYETGGEATGYEDGAYTEGYEAEAGAEATGYEAEAGYETGEATGYEGDGADGYGAEAGTDDGYGTDEAYADPTGAAAEGDSPWDFNEPAPPPPPARKTAPAMVKKGAPPAMKKAAPPPRPAMKQAAPPAAPPARKGPPPVMKKGGAPAPPPAMKKGAPPQMMKKGGPPPAMKKAAPPAPPMMKKGAPPAMKKGAPPRR